jgi:SAM-dependent methyltransferase
VTGEQALPPIQGVSILETRAQIHEARRELRSLGVGYPGFRLHNRLLRRTGRALGITRPDPTLSADPVKSWDLLLTIRAVLATTRRGDAVLDLGSVGSAILPALGRLGYLNLHGIDLDPAVVQMPEADSIDYRVGDMMSAPWADESFAAITAVSVIEHGLQTERLIGEVRRLLRPGGIFVFSTDYWPSKIGTEGLSAFGLPWMIFDAQEISCFFAAAREAGLRLLSPAQGIETERASRPIEWNGRSYTFLHAVLTRE